MRERMLEKVSKEKSDKIIISKLDEDEQIEKSIDLRNISSLKLFTLASAFGGTMGNSMDYGICDSMYFTNKKVYFVNKNVGGEPLSDSSRDRDDILGIVFTNRKVKVKKDEHGNLGIRVTRDKFKLASIITTMLFVVYGITSVVTNTSDFKILVAGLFIGIWTVAKCIQDLIVDRIKIVMKDGSVLDTILRSNDYDESRKYLEKISKSYKYI